ncbi:hypothetical protein KKI93_22055 [Xenorhabdus bovienii]|uniref:hypothetical protein n=1 Tax=Xenorhabdus bovienii TaxID=40576 RepID=UPI0023B31F08|nr:hypothetical protein [Xenorhabdus bovienii]MDE9484049.1 hypothetical protein [Xenorhabdus bovienii]MDE9566622.1 hypothetical protein [Xenorhabdus bovienii]
MSPRHQVAYNTLRQSIRVFEHAGVVSLCVPATITELCNQYPDVFIHRTQTSQLLNQLGFFSAPVTSLIASSTVSQINRIFFDRLFSRRNILILHPHRYDINQRIYEQEVLPYIVNDTYANFLDTVRNRYDSIVAAGVMIYLRG